MCYSYTWTNYSWPAKFYFKKARYNGTPCGCLPRVIARVLNIIQSAMLFHKIVFVKYSEVIYAQ